MKYSEWIDAYITGTLPPREKVKFEAALEETPALQKELALAQKIQHALLVGPPDESIDELCLQIANRHAQDQKSLFQQYNSGALSEAARKRFEEQLQMDELFAFEWEEFNRDLPLGVQKGRMYWAQWAAAAAVVLILGALSWWVFRPVGDANNALFAKYDVPELFPKADYALVNEGYKHKGIIGSDDFNELKINGLKAYSKDDWDIAIRLLSDYVEQAQPSDDELVDEINFVNLYIGRAWLEKGDLKMAIAFFQKADQGVTDMDNYALRQELIRWQLALAHLKNGNPKSAKPVLQSLRNAQHEIIRQQANELLNEIK